MSIETEGEYLGYKWELRNTPGRYKHTVLITLSTPMSGTECLRFLLPIRDVYAENDDYGQDTIVRRVFVHADGNKGTAEASAHDVIHRLIEQELK